MIVIKAIVNLYVLINSTTLALKVWTANKKDMCTHYIVQLMDAIGFMNKHYMFNYLYYMNKHCMFILVVILIVFVSYFCQ